MKVNAEQLKSFLEDSELIEENELKKAFQESQEKDKNFGDLLLEKKLISEKDLKKMYAYIQGVPFIDLEKKEIPKDVLNTFSEDVAKKNKLVAFDKNSEEIRVAMLNPGDIQVIDYLEKKTGLKISPCLTTQEGLESALKQYKKSLKAEFGDIIETGEKGSQKEEDLEKMAQDLPIIKIVDTLLEHAILQSASDIHIEPDEKEVRVRYRIDGVLHDAMTLPKRVMSGIVARIKVLSNLKLDEHRVPQDGRFKTEKEGKKISFRVSIMPVFQGEKIVMRVLDESSKGLTLEKLGLWGESLERVHRAIKQPNGIFLVTGPTGSGKTTTLYTILDILNTSEVNISTVEDPIEYQMPRINQTQVKSKVGMTFATGLRALLRQDPDIIMVGEIRDKETMQIALNAAMTGHLVLSTLHTNSAAAAVPRMIDMDAEPFLISSTVNNIMAQRLVRKICPDCKKSFKLNKKQTEEIEKTINFDKILKAIKNSSDPSLKKFEKIKSLKDVDFYRGDGCKNCKQEGYKGRLGVYESLEASEEIKKVISENATAHQIEEKAIGEGMNTMLMDGIVKAIRGETTIEEVLRVTKE
ncbi:MAG: GspE/PulE family protein [Patescibacteria group bacterium]